MRSDGRTGRVGGWIPRRSTMMPRLSTTEGRRRQECVRAVGSRCGQVPGCQVPGTWYQLMGRNVDGQRRRKSLSRVTQFCRLLALVTTPQHPSLDRGVVQVEVSRDDDLVRNGRGTVRASEPQLAKDLTVSIADGRAGTATHLDAFPFSAVFVVKDHAASSFTWWNVVAPGPRSIQRRGATTRRGLVKNAESITTTRVGRRCRPLRDQFVRRAAAWRAQRKTHRWITASSRSSSVATMISCTKPAGLSTGLSRKVRKALPSLSSTSASNPPFASMHSHAAPSSSRRINIVFCSC